MFSSTGCSFVEEMKLPKQRVYQNRLAFSGNHCIIGAKQSVRLYNFIIDVADKIQQDLFDILQ